MRGQRNPDRMADYHKARVPAWLAASAKSALAWRQGKKSARAASLGVSRGARGRVAARAAPPAAGGLAGARLLLGGLLPEPRLMWIRPTQSCSPRAGGEQESSRRWGCSGCKPSALCRWDHHSPCCSPAWGCASCPKTSAGDSITLYFSSELLKLVKSVRMCAYTRVHSK